MLHALTNSTQTGLPSFVLTQQLDGAILPASRQEGELSYYLIGWARPIQQRVCESLQEERVLLDWPQVLSNPVFSNGIGFSYVPGTHFVLSLSPQNIPGTANQMID
jgi:hypothetical protein